MNFLDVPNLLVPALCLTAGCVLGWGLTFCCMVRNRTFDVLGKHWKHIKLLDDKLEKLMIQVKVIGEFKVEAMRFMYNPVNHFNPVYLTIVFDPHQLWFSAGFNFEKTQIAQWSCDREFAAQALENFIADENTWTGTQIKARDILKPGRKLVIALDMDSVTSLEASAKQKDGTITGLLTGMLGVSDIEIIYPET